MKDIEGCVDEVKALYQYGMKWFGPTQSIRKEMEYIESQINITSSSYDLVIYLTIETRNVIEEMHKKFFQLQA